jgi:predicted nuclease of restriction endonuclease-like (RecB) superfamily
VSALVAPIFVRNIAGKACKFETRISRGSEKNSVRKKGAMSVSTGDLIQEIRKVILSARTFVVTSIDAAQVLANYEIGHRIVAHEQKGFSRAKYGANILSEISNQLTREFGRGFSETNLKLMRQFYLMYKNRIGQTASDGLTVTPRPAPSSSKFILSWSHYVFLLGIGNQAERDFYEIESKKQNWSLRELRRQFDSALYERLALSRDKKGLRKLSKKGQIVEKPHDLVKNPYVLEFLGLDERSKYSESDIESAIIDKLEHFLLELGKGFLFEARQKRFTFDEEHFFVDMVFYNRLLRCYVLIDLKIGKLAHQDLGQMQMYVNYFDRYVKTSDEKPSVGIILCKEKHDTLVKITLPKHANIFASQYQLYLPSKEELKQKLMEWSSEGDPKKIN